MKRITTRTPAQRIKRTIFAEYTFGALTRYGLDAHNKFKINWKKAHGVIKCRMIFYFILAHVWSKYHLREHTIDWRWVHRKWIIDYILWLMIRPSLVRMYTTIFVCRLSWAKPNVAWRTSSCLLCLFNTLQYVGLHSFCPFARSHLMSLQSFGQTQKRTGKIE